MKILIAYRGFHYKQGDGTDIGLISKSHLKNGLPFNISMVSENHKNMIFQPLRNMGYEVKIIGCTYRSNEIEQNKLTTELEHEYIEYISSENSTQMSTMSETIRTIEFYKNNYNYDYDWLIILRYDILYIHPISRWHIRWNNKNDPVYISFLSKGTSFISKPPRIHVSDCLYCLSKNSFNSFIYQCFRNRNQRTNHLMYIPFRPIVKGIFDANTSIQQNPLYIMAGRPLAKL